MDGGDITGVSGATVRIADMVSVTSGDEKYRRVLGNACFGSR